MRAKVIGLTLASVLVPLGAVAAAGEAPSRAVAYVNPDTGTATENADVDPDSSCESPDRRDKQQLSASGGSENNVHVDACLFDEGKPFDGMVTFESKGVGAISACPDPDQMIAQVPQVLNGEKRAYAHDHDGDGRMDHCHQTGYQSKDSAGDLEYHVRVNNDTKAGKQQVIFCFDPEQDPAADASGQPQGHGCKDAAQKSKVKIRWVP
jgi:hypothetical protein